MSLEQKIAAADQAIQSVVAEIKEAYDHGFDITLDYKECQFVVFNTETDEVVVSGFLPICYIAEIDQYVSEEIED
jgi:hypothetical protein